MLSRVKRYIPADIEILYLTLGGSHLYGTADENSDTDIWGICRCKEMFHFSTARENSPNTKNDVDILLLPEEEFVRRLSAGDIKAIDILFSYTCPSCILWGSADYIKVFVPYLNWHVSSVCSYIYEELRGYPVYGSMLWKIRKTIEIFSLYSSDIPLWDILSRVEIPLDTYTYEISGKKRIGVSAYNKKIQDVPVDKAVDILRSLYVSRLRADFRYKNMMHAIRTTAEFSAYSVFSEVFFPLPESKILLKIKHGYYPWYELMDRVNMFLGRSCL